MADAVELAAAYVSLVPSFEGAQGKITKELIPEAERAGDKAGEKAGSGFGSKFSGVLNSGGFRAGVAGGAAAVGLALADGFFAAVEGADASAKTAATLGLDPAEAQKAGDVAGAVYAGAYGESLTDVNAAVGSVMSSIGGMRAASAEDLQDITQKALNLSEAFGVDVGESATTAGILIKNGLAADADTAMDMITGSMQKVPASVRGEILPVMDEYSKHFAGLGIDGETAMGMIVAASADGAIGMDKMGDAVKEFQIRSTDMSATTRTAYEELGLNTEDMTRRLLAGGDSANEAMGEIVHALQGVEDPAAQSAAALALFGTPLEDLGADQIPNFLGMMDPMGDKFDSTAGAADSFGATLNSGPGVALEGLRRSVETTFMSFAEQALPALTAFSGWLSQNTWVVGVFAAVVGGLLVGAFIAWAASVWVATAALLANPVTWIIIGIVALVAALALLVANWDSVAAFLTGVWNNVVSWAMGVWSGLGDFFRGWISGVVSWFNSGISGLRAWLAGTWNNIAGFARGVWSGFLGFIGGIVGRISSSITGGINGVRSWLAGAWRNISSFAMSVWNGLVGWVRGIPGRFLGGLAALGGLAGRMGGWVNGARNAAVGAFNGLVGWVAGIPGRILGALGGLGGLLVGAGSSIIQGFLRGLQGAFESVKNFVGGIGQWIADNKGPKAYDLALLVPAGGWIMEGLGRGIADSMPALRRQLGDVSETIRTGLRGGSVDVSARAVGLADYDVSAEARDGGRAVYVQNPWTGEYLLARVDDRVGSGISGANDDMGRRRPGVRG
ncbi:tail length tape measure protein [Arthrobacter phage Kuleana]|uniref:Tape measure protein n=1 Tax=Arthrobacter phage Kuleana TaxID=2653270 RepID=A0A5Q2WB18_9CAUD|nr:tail length tape measure protein [Arthrobacter phage Kuleana]QGH74503.1 tape measure protein [Arthrobacter phage Kuleana]